MKIFYCKDLGGSCTWKTSAETVEELMKKITKHGTVKHNMKGMSEGMKTRIVNVIRDK